MSTPKPSFNSQARCRRVNHWAAVRKHWLSIPLVLMLSPAVGYWLASDRGLMFGLAVGCLASFWLWWEGDVQKEPPGSRQHEQ
jgi:hypothetical protein